MLEPRAVRVRAYGRAGVANEAHVLVRGKRYPKVFLCLPDHTKPREGGLRWVSLTNEAITCNENARKTGPFHPLLTYG